MWPAAMHIMWLPGADVWWQSVGLVLWLPVPQVTEHKKRGQCLMLIITGYISPVASIDVNKDGHHRRHLLRITYCPSFLLLTSMNTTYYRRGLGPRVKNLSSNFSVPNRFVSPLDLKSDFIFWNLQFWLWSFSVVSLLVPFLVESNSDCYLKVFFK